jgi:hypothetical protein
MRARLVHVKTIDEEVRYWLEIFFSHRQRAWGSLYGLDVFKKPNLPALARKWGVMDTEVARRVRVAKEHRVQPQLQRTSTM